MTAHIDPSTLTALSALELRPMSVDDLEIVLELDRASHLTPWSERNFRDALAAGNLCLIGERDGGIVACAVLQMAAGEAELLTMAVWPDARRSGVGRELLGVMIGRAREYGASAIWLEVRVSNAAAIELYRDAGFVEVGSRKGYYQRAGGREDAITMRREMSDR